MRDGSTFLAIVTSSSDIIIFEIERVLGIGTVEDICVDHSDHDTIWQSTLKYIRLISIHVSARYKHNLAVDEIDQVFGSGLL